MKEMLRLTLVLTVICTLAAALLAWVHAVTEAPIHRADAARLVKAVGKVLPPGLPDPVQLQIGGTQEVYAVFDETGAWQAVAFEAASDNGYGGAIRLMVGFTPDEKLHGYAVLKHQETPGLGAKIERDGFRGRLAGRPLRSTRWQVTKDGGDIEAITAATISSRAVLEAVRQAITRLDSIRDALRPPATTSGEAVP